MGYSFAGGGDGDQLFLLPPDPRDWLPPRHLAWELRALVAEMDLSSFMSWYRADGQGRRAYHPQLMVTLIGYCYCKGLRSSRAIEMATWDDVGARVICSGLHPDHSTIARFVTRHEQAVKGLLVQSLIACAKQGLVSVEVVAGDGTKIRANASMAASATAAQLDIDIAGLQELIAAEVTRWLAQARAEDAAEDMLFSVGDSGDGPAAGGGDLRKLAALSGKLARRQKARARIEAARAARREAARAAHADKIARLADRVARAERQAARAEAACQAREEDYQRRAAAKAAAGSRKRPDGRVPVPAAGHSVVRRARQVADKARQAIAVLETAGPAVPADPQPPEQASTTDPASRVMPAKHGGFIQGYNTQIIAGGHQIILGITTHDNPADTGALHPLLAAARANLAAAGITSPIGKALFDAGYASDTNFTTPCETELYVSVTREARQTGRLRDGKQPPITLPSWQAMTARLATPEGQAIYKQRSAMIEPVFAQLFNRLGRHLHYRDTNVDLELHLWAASHNLLKAIHTIRRNKARLTPRPA
jgi:transposase